MQQSNHWFLHVDLDAFFASVEQLDHPEYRGKPVIVGGKPEDKRSVVSTASYEARKYGVHSAMPTAQAYRLCPNGIYVHGRMERYAELSYKIMNIFKEYSPDVDQMSIDEAFIDITGTESLFGPPEETALKIKKQVKDYTGLTVSIGLATNKYLAKIASAMSKPDGFYYVKQGTEEDFMLSLPLSKVWGVGKKTLEIIKKSGLNTTRDLHEQPLENLQFMYGNNMGSFLYNAVRGIDTVGFGKAPKTHSISTETTFIEDISDIFTLETKLLELCHGLLFRLLKEKSFSRTAMVKIRYADFSTVSIQKTVDYNFMTLDSLFEVVKQIFNEKYDHKTGIRLIGVGLENIETKPQPEQLYLFDNNSEKKRNVEKAILNMEQKHPELKVQKARLLFNNIKNSAKILILGLLFLNLASFSHSQNINQTDSLGAAGLLPDTIDTSSDENPDYDFFEWNLPNSSLKYDISGYWAADFTGGANATFGNNSNFGISASTPVFKQEINLSALINITDNWFFNLDFADKFSKNTYTLGYEKEDYLKSFYLSNRNITFPQYSSELNNFSIAGGENQAPGASLHLSDVDKNKWSADFMLRYDLINQNDATFYGKNVVNDINIYLSNYIQGKIFVIPDSTLLQNIKNIYIEDLKGNFIDSNGRKYKKISDSDYKILSSKNVLILAKEYGNQTVNGNNPEILITFNNSNLSEFLINLGDYSNNNSYLGKIQKYFNQDNFFDIKLKNYSYNLTTEIEETDALIIQSNQGFSPFLLCSLYDCGIIQDAEPLIISSSTEIINNEYYSELSEDFIDFTKENFFYENHKYIQTGLYSKKSDSLTEPWQRYPFANQNPYIYLNSSNNSDLVLRIRKYTAISNYDIGKKASAGSIRVYINGILDPNAKYESSSGFVTLSRPVSDIDKIYITWNEESDDIQNGALAFAAGYKYNFSKDFVTDISFISSIPFSSFAKYAASNSPLASNTALTGGLKYSKNNLEISDALSLALINENFSGNYIANYQKESAAQTYYFSYSNGYATKIVPSLNFKNSPVLQVENNCSVHNYTGIGDKNITGYKIPLEWDFSNNVSTNKWASVDIKLASGDILYNSSELELALQSSVGFSDADVYLQLGILAEKEFTGETKALIPTWKLTGNEDSRVIDNFDTLNTKWQIVKILLSESDRAKLITNHDLRLIIVSKEEDAQSKGIIFTGPYEPKPAGNFVKFTDYLTLTSSVILINESPSSKELFTTDNQGTKISWTVLNSTGNSGDYEFSTENYFDYCDFSNYDNIFFDIFISAKNESNSVLNSEEGFEFVLDSPSQSSLPALKLTLSSEYLLNLITNEGWHSFNINKNDKTLFIDNVKVPSEYYQLEINTKIKPSRQKVLFNTCLNSKLFETGYIIIGNLYFKNIKPYFNAKNNFELKYSNESLGFIKNLSLNLGSQQSAVLSFSDKNNNQGLIDGYAKTDFSLLNFNFDGSINFDSSNLSNEKSLLTQTSHKISTTTPLFNIFSISDEFVYIKNAQELSKKFNSGIDLSSIKIPVSFNFSTNSQNNLNYVNQNINSDLSIGFDLFNTNFNFQIISLMNQKIDKKSLLENNDFENYFIDLINAYAWEFSFGNENASQRTEELSGILSLKLPFNEFSPSLRFSFNGNYYNKNEQLFSDKVSLSLNFPFTISTNKFSFNILKTAGGINPFTGIDYFTDIEQLFINQSQRNWFYTSLPFIDLFNNSIYTDLSTSLSIESFYSSKYEFNWKRNLSNNITDLFIPVSSSLAISRDTSKTDNITDIYQIKLTAGNAFVNLLGSKGKLKLLKNFTQDEFNSYLTGIIKIPATTPEKTTFQISWYGSLLLFIDSQNSVKTGADISIETNGDYLIRTTGIWTHKGTDTILLKIPAIFIKDFSVKDKKDLKIVRKENFNISLSQNDSIHSELFQYIHNCDLHIKNNYTITTGIGVNLKFTENSATTLGTEFSIGGKIEF